MSEMVRKQIYLDRGLNRLVKERAERSGVSQAEVIRDALERAFDLKGRRVDLEAWEEFKGFCESRAASNPGRHGRHWRREELCEERVSRRRGDD
jgi:hypothetical protein